MILFSMEYVVFTAKKGRIVLWAEAEEAAVRTTAHIIPAAIHIPAVHTDLPVLLTDHQVRHTDLRDLLTGPRVLRIRAIPEVHTDPEAAVVTADAQAAALADAGGS